MLILIILFLISKTFLVHAVTLSAKANQKISKLLNQGFQGSEYWNEYETKSENKNTKNTYVYFFESNRFRVNRLFMVVFLNRGNDIKRFPGRIYYLRNCTIKNYNIIFRGKSFYDKTIDYDMKRHKKNPKKIKKGKLKIIPTIIIID